MATVESTDIYKTSFSNEIKFGFSQYARYVIADRAIPDARDGLKPVHRRILWAMHQLGLGPRSAFKKCARIVGETTGRYHPHAGGVYESLVRLGQHWSLRYPLVEPQGNFGSIDGFPPAAMRYTEARLSTTSSLLLQDISPNVVEFIDNFDGEEQEPTVLSVRVPNLLLNGSYGIAVGISSNIPPQNLTELLNACLAIVDNPKISSDELAEIITGPDFPTGGIIIGVNGIKTLYKTGRGSLRLRSRVHTETPETHKINETLIVVDEIPYMQNKSSLMEAISKLIDEGKLRGVKDVRDLSKKKIRIEFVIDEQYSDPVGIKTILAQLYKSTNLETLFHGRITAFVYGRPLTLNLKQALSVFLDFREITIRAIAQEELDKVLARLHILEGLIIASDDIDAVINLIRASESRKDAHDRLMAKYGLSDLQAKAVLDLTLARLARVEQMDLKNEAEEKRGQRDKLVDIVENRSSLLKLMKEEFQEILSKYDGKDPRKTSILEIDDIMPPTERPILHERKILISSTGQGYLRSIDHSKFKVQGRGGRGVAGIPMRDDTFLYDMVVVSNLDDLLLITQEGIIHQIPAFEIPEVKNRTARGSSIRRFLPVEGSIVKVVNVQHDSFTANRVFVTVTKSGMIKRTNLDKYSNIRRTGIKCLVLKAGDEVVDAFITDKPSYIFMATKNGSAAVFDGDKARLTGRVAQGVIGMKLRAGDEVVCAFSVPKDEYNMTSILTVTEKGYGKRTPLNRYRITNRGAMGVRNIKTGDRNGSVVNSIPVPIETGDITISLVNSEGILIKIGLKGIRNMGRATMGVRIMRQIGDQKLLMATSITDESETEETESVDSDAGETDIKDMETVDTETDAELSEVKDEEEKLKDNDS